MMSQCREVFRAYRPDIFRGHDSALYQQKAIIMAKSIMSGIVAADSHTQCRRRKCRAPHDNIAALIMNISD